MESLRRAIRSLARTPGFALVAIVTLALAVASVGTIFSVVNAVLLKPLPFPGSERIVRVVRVQGACTDCPITRPGLFAWREQSTDVFEALGSFNSVDVTLSGGGEAEKLPAYRVTPEFWTVFAVPPLLGRTFDATEDRENRPVVVISHGLWQRRFGGDTGAVGKTLLLNGQQHTVVGVMPAYFTYPTTDVWLPAQLASATTGDDSNYLSVVARLRDGATLGRAHDVLAAITARQAQASPDNYANLGAKLVPLQERLTGSVRPALTVMLAASALVVLIACANLANLMLARAQARRRELAVRAALGASRRRLLWVLTVESLVVAALGTMIGVALVFVALDVLPKLAPDLLPAYNPLAIDGTVVGFVAGVAVFALLAFGLAPAWTQARAQPAAALSDETRGGAGGRGAARARAALVVGEVALSLVLLAGAALLLESLRRLSDVDPTIDVDRLAVARVALPSTQMQPGEEMFDWVARHSAAATPRVDTLLETIAALPEVENVAFTDAVPLSGRGNTNSTVNVIGREYPGGEDKMPLTEWRFVSAGYFDTVGLAVVRGRAFRPEDSRGPGITTEVIVNDVFVRTFLADVDPIGQQLDVYNDEPKTIVGVVESARQWGLARDPSPEVYIPVYDAFVSDLELVVRTRVPPERMVEPLRRVLRATAPDLPVSSVTTLAQVVRDGDTLRRFFATLMIAFSAVALALAMVGLYGVIAYSVAQRRVEIGVRMSLGANGARVLAMVLRQGLALVGAGLALGVAGALALSGVVASLLYGVGPRDPFVLGAVALALLATGALACAVPAWRAARVAPVEALRHM